MTIFESAKAVARERVDGPVSGTTAEFVSGPNPNDRRLVLTVTATTTEQARAALKALAFSIAEAATRIVNEEDAA